jgi:hypothetical protein
MIRLRSRAGYFGALFGLIVSIVVLCSALARPGLSGGAKQDVTRRQLDA